MKKVEVFKLTGGSLYEDEDDAKYYQSIINIKSEIRHILKIISSKSNESSAMAYPSTKIIDELVDGLYMHRDLLKSALNL